MPKIYRNAYGNWTTETRIELPNGYVLKILTMKRYSGNLVTSAQCNKKEGQFEVFRGGTDFTQSLISERVRVTPKAVERQHAAAMEGLAALLEKVKRYNEAIEADILEAA